MRKFLTLALTAILLTGAASSATATTPKQRHVQCRYGTLDGRWSVWGTREVKRTIACAVSKYPTSLSTAMYVADRESGFYARAVNSSSGTCGIYQHMPRYWAGRVASFRHEHPQMIRHRYVSCFNARANVLVSIWMAHKWGWGPWAM